MSELTPNGSPSMSMEINRGFNSDPFRPKRYHVAAQNPDGSFINLSPRGIDEPIETLRMHVEQSQLIGFKEAEVVIIDADTGVVVEKFESYKPEPQGADDPITPRNAEIRDRWIGKMIQWLVPKELMELDDTPENQARIQTCLSEQGVSIAQSPGGTKTIFFRKNAETGLDEEISYWCAFL